MPTPTKQIETRFMYTLNQLLKTIQEYIFTKSNPTSKGVIIPQTPPQEIIRLLSIYATSSAYKDYCDKLALSITTQVDKVVSKTWRQAAQKAGRGNEIYNAILTDLKTPKGGVFYEIVRANAKLIKTFPNDMANDIGNFLYHNRTAEEAAFYISEQSRQGRRSSDITNDLLKKFPDIAKQRLQLIARTEVSKTQSALTQARALSLGLNWYIWRTSSDARVRSSHEHMEGVLINFNDPPNPEALDTKGRKDKQGNQKSYGNYHAGNIFNCRCYEEVVTNLNYIKFPARVYRYNAIIKMTRAEFERIS